SQNCHSENSQDQPQRDPKRRLVEMRDQHLESNQHEHKRQSIVQKAEHGEEVLEGEIQRSQAENRKDIGRVHDKGIAADGQNGGNRIHGKDQIGGFDDQQSQEQRCRQQLSVLSGKEICPIEVGGNGKVAAKKLQHDVLFWINIGFAAAQQADAAVDQDRAEDVDEELEAAEE